MPRQPHYLTTPVTIAKSDIAKYTALHDFANSVPYELNGKTYPTGTIRFATFAGARGKDGLYSGVYRFEEGDFSGCLQSDLNQLPGLKAKPFTLKSEGINDG